MSQDVFISYAREEIEAANMVRLVLERNGISCWMDVEGIHGGDDFGVEIPAAIKACRAVVFILSARSQRSQWTKKEITTALNLEKPVLPIAIEKCDVIDPFDFYFSNVQRGIAYGDVAQSLANLVYDVKALMHEKTAQPVIPRDAIRGLTSLKRRTWIREFALVALGVLAAVAALRLVVPLLQSDDLGGAAPLGEDASQPAATVYASDCFHYSMAGFVNSYEEVGSYDEVRERGSGVVNIYEAFSILSFVRNESQDAARVESVSFEVLDLEPIEEPRLILDVAMHEQTMLAYVANNGWGSAPEASYEFYVTSRGASDARFELSDIASGIEMAGVTDLRSGEVRRILRCEVDLERYKELAWSEERRDYSLGVTAVDSTTGEKVTTWGLLYDEERGLRFANGAGDGGTYGVTLFAVLDVDARPTSIRFANEEATPRVEDTYRIETVIAPTKSCYLRCKDVYSVNGELQETPEYELYVTVPVLANRSFGLGEGITEELAADPDMGQAHMQEIADSYRYDPTVILEGSSEG